MRVQVFTAAVVILAMGACKTTYKATDRPGMMADSTASTIDTSAAIKKTPESLDSAAMSNRDSAIIDSTSRQLPDSVKISSATQQMDAAQKQPANERTATAMDSAQTNTKAPAAAEAVFSKQYPGAVNVLWSAYDSLAAIPIDMRLTGWKKMDADDHMVKFDFKEETYYAWYDNNGKWIGSAYTVKDLSKLPAGVSTAVNNAIKTRYTGYSVSQVNRELQTDNKSAYEVELIKENSKIRMLVTPSGKINEIYRYSADKAKQVN